MERRVRSRESLEKSLQNFEIEDEQGERKGHWCKNGCSNEDRRRHIWNKRIV